MTIQNEHSASTRRLGSILAKVGLTILVIICVLAIPVEGAVPNSVHLALISGAIPSIWRRDFNLRTRGLGFLAGMGTAVIVTILIPAAAISHIHPAKRPD